MINRLLRAKHWQIFMLTFGMIMLTYFISIVGFIVSIPILAEQNDTVISPFALIAPFGIFILLMFLAMAVHLAWNWSVAIGLQQYVPEEAKMNMNKFKWAFFFPLFYIILFIGGMFALMTSISFEEPPLFLFTGFGLIFPLHMLAMFCQFYCLYFIAKTFKAAELQRKVTFSDYAGEFFLIWFFFIGIWFVQPKINKMVEGEGYLES